MTEAEMACCKKMAGDCNMGTGQHPCCKTVSNAPLSVASIQPIVQRGIVRQHLDDVKTATSHKAITVTETMIATLKTWKQTTQFSDTENWVFASPSQHGKLPWSADAVNDAYKKAASAAKVEHVSTHSMRHTYRSWLDAVGTPIAVQQKLMRHADIRTTMNTYGDVVTDEMARAASKVAGLALNGTEAARGTR
jgi:integrase